VIGVPNGTARHPGCSAFVSTHGSLEVRAPYEFVGEETGETHRDVRSIALYAHGYWQRTWFEDPREDEKGETP
jgi:hypothetical protein